MNIDTIITGDSAEVLQSFPDACIDLTVTSPPYDNLRTYEGDSAFDFEAIARQLFRVTKAGGVVVWVVGDSTVNGSESGTSFKQALFFKECGFNLHDTMIWNKGGFSATGSLAVRYAPVFEYMFILSKGFPKTFNPIKDHKSLHAGKPVHGTIRGADNAIRQVSGGGTKRVAMYSQRYNIWNIDPVKQNRSDDHPAPFRDHIISWSSDGDTILDPFAGSGTTLKMAKELSRHYIGIERVPKYVTLAEKRLLATNVPLFGGVV